MAQRLRLPPITKMKTKEEMEALIKQKEMPSVAKFLTPHNNQLISNRPRLNTSIKLAPLRQQPTAPIQQPTPEQLFLDTKTKVFSKNSANCIFIIIGDVFYKIELSNDDMSDPLLNEVFMMQFLYTPDIFPEYKSHFLIDSSIVDSSNPSKKIKVVAMQNLVNAEPLRKVIIRSSGSKSYLSGLETLLNEFKIKGETMGLIHSDLHANNIQMSGDTRLYVIDFGRVFLHKNATVDNKFRLQGSKNFEQFDINISTNFKYFNTYTYSVSHYPYPYYFPTHLSIGYRNPTYITGEERNIGYMCDIAQVAFFVFRANDLSCDFMHLKQVGNNAVLELNFTEFQKVKADSILQRGLKWLASYLFAVMHFYNIICVNSSVDESLELGAIMFENEYGFTVDDATKGYIKYYNAYTIDKIRDFINAGHIQQVSQNPDKFHFDYKKLLNGVLLHQNCQINQMMYNNHILRRTVYAMYTGTIENLEYTQNTAALWTCQMKTTGGQKKRTMKGGKFDLINHITFTNTATNINDPNIIQQMKNDALDDCGMSTDLCIFSKWINDVHKFATGMNDENSFNAQDEARKTAKTDFPVIDGKDLNIYYSQKEDILLFKELLVQSYVNESFNENTRSYVVMVNLVI